MTKIDLDNLISTAKQRTGLDDFGDVHFIDALEVMVTGINNRDDLIEDRMDFLVELTFIRPLVNILYYVDEVKKHPEIHDQQLLPPVTVVSLPRCGTTKLQRILSATDTFQDVPLWQLHMPARIPGQPDDGREQRRAETLKFLEWTQELNPDLLKGHPMSVDAADEDVFLFWNVFLCPFLGIKHDSAEYVQWFDNTSMAPAYDFMLQQLKYLQWQFGRDNPRPYLLKGTSHAGYIDQLERIFSPEQKIIMSHRDPIEVVGSNCLAAVISHNDFYQPVANEVIGEMMLKWLVKRLDDHLQWRNSQSDLAVLDLSFSEVCNDSVATAEKVYNFTGVELNDEGKAQIREWDKNNPRYARGKSEYSLEQFGLTPDQVNEAFAPYLNRFSEYI